MYLLSSTIPLLNSLLAWTYRKKLHTKRISQQLCLGITIRWLLRIIILYECIINETFCQTSLWSWIITDYLQCKISFITNSLTSSMLFIVTTVSLFVHLYSIRYMKNDPHINRFMSYLSLFTFFMIILINRNNTLNLLIGWEGVGICSYLLINFWFTRTQANKAGIKAIIINRIRDTTLIIGIILIIVQFGRTKFENINKPNIIPYNINIIRILLLISATGKSSLIGLHVWLPDAMEGPTPVSALIHAATMVTAGIFLLIRSSYLLEKNNRILLLIAWLGAITAFFAATTRSFQNDIKRIIAYSTCRQLGFMALTIGLSYFSIRLLHLINHAFFKRLLFLGAGVTIHTLNNEQDLRKLSNLFNQTPLSHIRILIGSLTLAGLPFLTRYYSKDLIIENSYKHRRIFWLTLIRARLTALYSSRLIYLTFILKINSKLLHNKHHKNHNNNINLTLIFLRICRILAGFYFWYLLLRTQAHTQTPTQLKILPLTCRLLSAIFIIKLHTTYPKQVILLKQTYAWKNLIRNAWYFNTRINNILAQKILNYRNNLTYKKIDQGILEDIGPKHLTYRNIIRTNTLSTIQSSNIHIHLTTLIIFYTRFMHINL